MIHEKLEKVVGVVGRAFPDMAGKARPASDFPNRAFVFFAG